MNILGKFICNNTGCRQTTAAPLFAQLKQYTLRSLNRVPMKANSLHVLKIHKVVQTQE
jgi:hypothetical protein